MKKLIAAVALVAAFVVSRGASAAVFDVYAKQTAPGSGQWELSVGVAGAQGLAALNIQFANVTGMVLNPLATGISTSDTLFISEILDGNGDPIPGRTGAIIQGGASGANSLPLFPTPAPASPPGSYGFLLATLTAGNSANPISLIAGEFGDVFGGTTFITPTGAAFADYSLTVVPEPTVALLLGMGLAGLALARRKA